MAERKRRSTKKKKEEQEMIEETQVEENKYPEDHGPAHRKRDESNKLPPGRITVVGDGDTGITPEELSKILKPTKQEDEETEAPGKKEPTKEELFQIALVDCLITRARMPEAEAKELIERLGLSLESRADIVKLFSDDIISLKMKFREFKRRFIQNNK